MKVLLIMLTVVVTPTTPVQQSSPNVTVIGASASAGWGVVVQQSTNADQKPRLHHRHIHLGDVLDAIITPASSSVQSHATSLFFQAPRMHGDAQVSAVLADDSDVVVALDFLFWHTYGNIMEQDGQDVTPRMKNLEVGLAQLDRIEAPVIVGDIPDMREATKAWPFPLLQSNQVPSKEAIQAINKRIAAWAAAQPLVTVIPLHDITKQVRNSKTVMLGGRTWPITARFVQADGLHPTSHGLFALAVLAADATAAASDEIEPPSPDLSAEDVLEALQPAIAAQDRQ